MLSDRSPNTFARSKSLVKHLMLTAVIIALVLSPVAVRASAVNQRVTELQQKVNRLQGQIRDMQLAIDPMNAQAEVDKERLRAQGDVRTAALQRSSRRELENSLLESRREIDERCNEVDNARCVDVCQLNDEMHNIQQTCDLFQREYQPQPQNQRAADYQEANDFNQEVYYLQAQIQDIQLRIDAVNDQAEDEINDLRALGRRREAGRQRVSENELGKSLQECKQEVVYSRAGVDDELFLDVGQKKRSNTRGTERL